MNKIKVAYVDHAESMGGAEYSLYYLLKEIDKDRVVPYLITPNNSELQKLLDNDSSIKIINAELGSVKSVRIFNRIHSLVNIFKKEDIDIVHANSYRAAIYSLIAGKLAKKQTIWHVRDIFESSIYRKIMPFFSDKLIVISKAVSKQFSKKVTSKKAHLIYNGVDLKLFNNNVTGTLKSELSMNKQDFLIGMVGRIDRWKGFHHLISVIPQISKELNDFKIAIVGEEILTKEKGYKAELITLAENLGVGDKVVFLGNRFDIPNVMKSFDIFISYSKAEPFGRVIVEAMAMETPVIVANSGGAPEIVDESGCGLIVEGSSQEELIKSIKFLIRKRNDLNHMGLKGRKRVENHFNAKMVGSNVLSVYDSLIGLKLERK